MRLPEHKTEPIEQGIFLPYTEKTVLFLSVKKAQEKIHMIQNMRLSMLRQCGKHLTLIHEDMRPIYDLMGEYVNKIYETIASYNLTASQKSEIDSIGPHITFLAKTSQQLQEQKHGDNAFLPDNMSRKDFYLKTMRDSEKRIQEKLV